MDKQTQETRVLQYLNEFGSITPLEALRGLGVMRLSAVIYNLRHAGYDIVTTMVAVKNRYGGTSRIASYSMRAA